jgi:AcrR family transcriptional regulator
MGRGRAAGYEEQRGQILACAAQLFAHRGYPATAMTEVAQASGLSKATLYHYYPDKYTLLVSIAQTHVTQLQAIVDGVLAQGMAPEPRLRALITQVLQAYAGAQHAHRVLTEDVRFLLPEDQRSVLDSERAVVAGFAATIRELRPDLRDAALDKPLTMLLFGMINWLFTWMKPGSGLDHEDIAQLVQDLFLGGLPAVKLPQGLSQAS